MTLRIHPDAIVRDSTSGLLAAHPSWERVALEDVAHVLNGFAFKSSYFSKVDGMPLLRIRDVGKPSTNAFYTGPFEANYLVTPGELVVGMDGDFRVARWLGPDALLNQRVCKVTVRDHQCYDPAFLANVLQGYLDAINAHTSSVTVKHLSSRTVQEIPLPLPPLNEQRRIVAAIEEHLSRLDAADGSLATGVQRLAALRAAVVAEALGGEWPLRHLREVTASQAYGTSAKASGESGGVPVLRMGNIQSGALDLTSLKYLPSEHPDVAKLNLTVGDVLFNRTNSPELVGKSAVFDASERMTFASYLIRVRLTEECDPHWAVLAINGPSGRRYVAEVRTQQTGQANVNGTKLADMPIPLPPLADQRRIVARIEEQLSAIDALRSAIERARRRSASLRRAVLERAFRGELVPQDPSDEPASTLVERIQADRAQTPGQARSAGHVRRTQ